MCITSLLHSYYPWKQQQETRQVSLKSDDNFLQKSTLFLIQTDRQTDTEHN